MKIILLILLSIFSAHTFAQELLLIGGGDRTTVILKKMISMSKGNILIVPLASEIPDEVAEVAVSELKTNGARNIQVFSCRAGELDQEVCIDQIQKAGLIYFTGGSQNRLLDAFKGTRSFKIITQRFEKDLSLAGTSAGTAIMSEVMLTGSPLAPYEDFDGVRPNMVETTKGFGFVKKIIIDQHFLKRNRQNRLMSAVFDHPTLVGVGIDEATAIHVDQNENFTVLGNSDVMVYDARKATIMINTQNEYETSNVIVKRLKPGSSFKF
jgi:cyanophycinase